METFGGGMNRQEDDGSHLDWTPEKVLKHFKDDPRFKLLSQEYPWYTKVVSNIANRFQGRNVAINEISMVLSTCIERRVKLSKIDERGKGLLSKLKYLGSATANKVEKNYLNQIKSAEATNPSIKNDLLDSAELVLDEYFPKKMQYEKVITSDIDKSHIVKYKDITSSLEDQGN